MSPYFWITAVHELKYDRPSDTLPALPSRPAQNAASSDCSVPTVAPLRKSTCLYQTWPFTRSIMRLLMAPTSMLYQLRRSWSPSSAKPPHRYS